MRRSRARAKSTSHAWQRFVTSATAKQSCSQGTSEISLHDLAAELGVSLDRLQPLLDHQYLRFTRQNFVVRPKPAAIAWLRTMFQPLTMRPWLSSQMVADLTGVRIGELQTLCLMYDVPLQSDPVFGELMSIASFHRFFNCLHHYRDPSRFDRQALLRVLMEAISYKDDQEMAIPKLPFSRRLDHEIRRIARLDEPDRTFRATALLEAYRDAKGVADAFTRYKGLVEPDIEGMVKLEEVVRKSTGI